MKKTISLLLAAIVAMSLLAGCTGNPNNDTTSEPTEVTTEPTTEPTEAPTEELTEAPTEESTETPTEVVAHDWVITIPEGFAKINDAETSVMWMAEDVSQIMVMTMPADETILTSPQDEFITSMASFVDEGSAVINEYTTTELDGFPALYVDFNYTVSGTPVHSYYYFAIASQTYWFMFNDYTAEDTWAEPFQQSAQSINILEDAAA